MQQIVTAYPQITYPVDRRKPTMHTVKILESLERSNCPPFHMVSASKLKTVPASAASELRQVHSHTIDHLTTSIVHDLRNPLTAIWGCAGHARSRWSDDR